MTGQELALGATGASLTLHSAAMAAYHWTLWRRRRQARVPLPPRARPHLVSILKPLAGVDDELEENLASFARLRGPPYEIVLGVASTSDPAYAVARKFVAQHAAARLMITDRDAAQNPKVAQLVRLESAARGDVIVISDSNVRVDEGYLEHLVAPLAEEDVGLVTNLFAGTGEQTLGAALENLQLAANVTPAVVLSTWARMPICVGKSMALRRSTLARIGGIGTVGDYLAEDYVLGRKVVEAGLRAIVSFRSIENRNVSATVPRTFARHARWTKLRRAIHAPVFAIEPASSPIVIATLATLLAPSQTTAAALGISALVQTILALLAVRASRGTWLAPRYAVLELFRAYMLFGCWLAAWASRSVLWRGNRLAIGRDTRLLRARRRSDAALATLR